MPLNEIGLWLGFAAVGAALYLGSARLRSDRLRAGVRLLAFASAAIGVNQISYASYFGPVGEAPGVFWLSSGLLVATLIATERRWYPAYALVAALVHLHSGMFLHDLPWTASAFWTCANVSEGVVGSLLLRSVIAGTPDITRPRTFVFFLVLCAGVGTAVSAAIGSTALAVIYEQTDWFVNWQVWWVSDAMGVLSLGTALLAWNNEVVSVPSQRRRARMIECIALCVLLVLTTVVALGPLSIVTRSVLDYPYLVLPLLFWAALRFDVRLATAAALFVAVVAVYTANGTLAQLPGIRAAERGPFRQPGRTIADTVLAIQAFLFVTLFTTQLLVALTYQRRRDEHDRLALQDQLYASQRMESLAQLASGVAHDLNNLLAVISLYRDQVEQRVGNDPALTPALRAMDDAAENAASVSRSLLDLSRHDHSDDGPIDLSWTLQRAMRVCQPLLPGRIRVSVQASSPGPVVQADPRQLQQVVLNLVLNARDAMAGAGGSLRVWAQVYEQDPSLAELGVSDTGRGIAAEQLASIFEPLYTTKPRGEGTGLGLSIVRSIVEGHHGRVDVESQPGQGAVFRVLLPRVGNDGPLSDESLHRTGVFVSSSPDAKGSEPASGAEVNGRPPVLLLMDQPQLAGVLRAELSARGWSAVGVRDLTAYLSAASNAQPGTVGVIDTRSLADTEAALRLPLPIPTVLIAVGEETNAPADPRVRVLAMPFHLRELVDTLADMG